MMDTPAQHTPPLYGLVLSGGRSTRMGTDKGLLRYTDAPQVRVCMTLLASFCEEVYLSCREDQGDWPDYGPHPRIHDQSPDIGPMGGVFSAMTALPEAAWLVLACDMPHMTPEILSYLVLHRQPKTGATAFRTSAGFPEPLCSIYEPGLLPAIRLAVEHGDYSLSRLLERTNIALLNCPEPEALVSINTPQDVRRPTT